MKKWLWIIAGTLAALVGAMWAIGEMLPQGHVASRQARYTQSPAAIWQAITEAEKFPQWRADVKSVARKLEKNGLPAWVETSDSGEIPLEVTEMTAPRRLVTKIADASLPFGGAWTFEIAAVEGGATLRITENGEVYPPIFRFLSRFVFGHAATIEQYLKALGRKFGEDVSPEA